MYSFISVRQKIEKRREKDMPRKTKSETTTAAKSAKTKTIKEKKATTSTKKTAATKKSKTKPESNITEIPKHSEIILDYSRYGNIGFSTVHEIVDISFLTKKKLTGKITTLFHFLRNTPVTSERDTGKTATFQLNGKPVIGITQKANDYDGQVFTLTKYKPDGSKQSTRRYSYIKTKNLILQAYGFMEIDENEDTEQPEESENSNEDMKLLPESANFENDSNNGFDEID